jgi:hypothetical protein
MDDLLKEAIADAKAVRETALANAKIALEEAFTPRLKSMLSRKIEAELSDDDSEVEGGDAEAEDDVVDGEAHDEPADDSEVEPEMGDDETYSEDEEAPEDDAEVEDIPEEEGEEDDMDDEPVADEPIADEEDDELDLNAVLAELEAELKEEEDEEDEEDAPAESVEESEEVTEDEKVEEADEVEEQSTSSGIGKGTGVKQASGSDEEDPGKGKLKEVEEVDEEVDESKDSVDEAEESVDEAEEVDEDIDLEEVLRALSEEDDVQETVDEVEKLQAEIKEHRDVVKYLREKLNEVNLLNAKLLFSNKLFRAFGLSNEQKLKVVETFDRTKNLREIKLVYATLAESFQNRKPIKESKGSSSKAVASTKPKNEEVLTEGHELKNRFKKLANIL